MFRKLLGIAGKNEKKHPTPVTVKQQQRNRDPEIANEQGPSEEDDKNLEKTSKKNSKRVAKAFAKLEQRSQLFACSTSV